MEINKFKGRGAKVVAHHVIRDHMLLGAILALILSRFWPAEHCLLFWLATVLVDADHYINLLFWSRFRCFSIKKLIRFYGFIVENKKKYPIFLTVESFHTVEFVALLLLASYGWDIEYLKPAFWGVFFHVFVDFFHLLRVDAIGSRKNSFLEFFFRRAQAMKRGLDPTQTQRDAAAFVMSARP